LVRWADIGDSKRREIIDLYVRKLTERLLRCHQLRDDLVSRIGSTIESQRSPQSDKRAREVPNVIGLQGAVEGFLYEAKNYIRDVLNLFRIVYGCELTDASAFTNLKGEGDSELVTWAASTFGPDSDFTELLRTEQDWLAEPIRMRNAVEHPGGLSGRLTFNNIQIDSNNPDSYILPTWGRTGRPQSDVVNDMDCGLENMLTLAEDLLAFVAVDKSQSKKLITVREIPIEDRDPKCPTRLRIELSHEVIEPLSRQATQSPESKVDQLSRKQLLRQQDRAWREKNKRGVKTQSASE
jgi:hypothetical protein